MTLTNTLPEHWKYVSEGGATIVFSYNGPHYSKYNGTVLRLRKSPCTDSIQDSVEAMVDEPDDPTIEFQQKCMERLIPSNHLPHLESVRVDRDWLQRLAALHDSERPKNRRSKDQVDLARCKGVLATDLVGGCWLAVEIKPKWAFLPPATHLSDATRPTKLQTCRFCMHSLMKSNSNEKASLGYCPLDLFSGQEDRVKEAIHALWDAWVESNGTVNNLKIFVHGQTITPFQAKTMLSDTVNLDVPNLRDAFTSSLIRPLLETPVLRILSTLQRTLDVLDIEGLSKLWRLAVASNPRGAATSPVPADESMSPPLLGAASLFLPFSQPTINDWSLFLDKYLSSIDVESDHSNLVPEHLYYYTLAYLLSATFKDCSIIVRLDYLQPTLPVPAVKAEQVTVIDLDPKSVAKLREWELLDQKIVETYIATGNHKICFDAWK